jgi:hypothetical protein
MHITVCDIESAAIGGNVALSGQKCDAVTLVQRSVDHVILKTTGKIVQCGNIESTITRDPAEYYVCDRRYLTANHTAPVMTVKLNVLTTFPVRAPKKGGQS